MYEYNLQNIENLFFHVLLTLFFPCLRHLFFAYPLLSRANLRALAVLHSVGYLKCLDFALNYLLKAGFAILLGFLMKYLNLMFLKKENLNLMILEAVQIKFLKVLYF